MKKNEVFFLKKKQFMPYGKIWKIMKAWSFIMLAFVIHVSGRSYSQVTRLSMEMQQVSIKQVLATIEEQSEFRFLYSDSKIDVEKKVDVSYNNKPVEEILRQIFAGTNVRFKVVGKQILLSNAAEKEQNVQQPQLTVTGKVTDSSGAPLPGVSVAIKGTARGTITDANGNYSLPRISPGDILQFSFIGLKSESVIVRDQLIINMVLREETIGIEEVVAVGYGTQRKVTLSGSVASVTGKEIIKVPAMNVTNTLGGSVPGLVAVGQSGEPGADYSTLYIRGKSTLNDNSPLIVVDGVPNRSLERIDPASIESVTILKDASGAIYGSQAANGVILVTTKRGSLEKYSVTANFSAGWSQPTKIPVMTSSAEFAELSNEVMAYRDKSPLYTEEAIEKYRSGLDPWNYPSTNWFKEVLKPWSFQQVSNLTMTGGSENLKAFISLSTRSQDGFFKNSASKYYQHDLRSNIDKKINNYMDLSLDASFRLEQREFPATSSASIFRDLVSAMPMQIARWPNGLSGPPLDPTTQNNPVVQATPEAGLQEGENYVFNINSKLIIKIPGIDGLTFTATGSLDRGLNYFKNFSKRYNLYSWDGTSLGEDNLPVLQGNLYGKSQLSQTLQISKQYLLNGYFQYQKKISPAHQINLTAGIEFLENNYNWFSAQRLNFTQNYPAELNFGDANQQFATGSNPGTNRWQNYFGRVNYSIKDKYIAEFVWRYQGSSKFAPETRWGFFPGVSLAYRISEEKFWKEGTLGALISDLKLRSSLGKTGNDLIPPYQFFSLYNKSVFSFVTGDGVYHPMYFEALAGNAKAQWEEAKQFNAGIDLSLFRSRLTITADYFDNQRTKILISQTASVPQFTGASGILPKINLGKVNNHGLDLEIRWRDNIGALFYSIGINALQAHNKVLFFDEAEGSLPWQKQTGYAMESGLYYIAKGIFHTQEEVDAYPHMANARPGDIIFEDVSGDGKIDGNDMKRVYKNTVPTLTGGLTISLRYSVLDLSVLLQGQAGAVRYIPYTGSAGGQNYFRTFYQERWTPNNPYANWPRTFNRNDEYWVSSSNPNTFWLRKTDFIRLKNVEVGLSVPNPWSNKIGLSDIRFFVSGMNLITYAPDFVDFDPELEPKGDGFAGQGYPLQRIINTGLTVKF
jgi:TonB-linked SusC/RagA family outer membrane protein